MTEEYRVFLNSAALLIMGSALAFLSAKYWSVRNDTRAREAAVAAGHAATLARIAELEMKLALVTQSVQPISAALANMLIKELTHPDAAAQELDALLVRLGPPNVQTPEERERMEVLLIHRTRDFGRETTQADRDAAVMLPLVLARIEREEKANETGAGPIISVSLPADKSAEKLAAESHHAAENENPG